jgi:signal transduction histidine kinase
MIFDEFTRGRHLYLILQGRVRIIKFTSSGSLPRLAILHEGDFFGELSVIDGLPRSARAEAVDPCLIAILSATDFRRLLAHNTQFAFNILHNLAIRLRTIDQTFVRELDHSEEEARAKMDKLGLLIEASKTVNSTLDLDRLLDLILDAARRSIKADRGTLYLLDDRKGELWSKAAHGDNLFEIRLPVGKGLAGYVARTGETINIRDAYKDPRFNPEIDLKSGYKTKTALCMPMRDKEGKTVGVFQLLNKDNGAFTDEDEAFIAAFSVHAAIALQNARLVQETVQNERLAAVGRMAAQIVHDIRSPMATLRLYAEIIKKKSAAEDITKISMEMMKQIDRFTTMTREILDFSRGVSELKPDTIDIKDLVNEGLEGLGPEMTRRNISLVKEFNYEGEWILDPDKMVRVFHNIASNAMDAMSEGGMLRVRVDQNDQNLCVEFADTGHGMTEEIKAKIFQPFFTFGKALGTGLGLAIVKKIIDDHHGSVEVASEVGKGTIFRLSIPKLDG